jgi:hypothetical protein
MRPARESPKRRQRGGAPGVTGSSPLKTPASTTTGPARTAAIATARSRICARWWFTGYLTNGRIIGSSVPNGANPLPAASESRARPTPTAVAATSSCR